MIKFTFSILIVVISTIVPIKNCYSNIQEKESTFTKVDTSKIPNIDSDVQQKNGNKISPSGTDIVHQGFWEISLGVILGLFGITVSVIGVYLGFKGIRSSQQLNDQISKTNKQVENIADMVSVLKTLVYGEDYDKLIDTFYEGAKIRIYAYTNVWSADRGRASAMMECEAPLIIFLGLINKNEHFPKVLWRLSISNERKQSGKSGFNIYHITKEDAIPRFVVADDDVLLPKTNRDENRPPSGDIFERDPVKAKFYIDGFEREREKICQPAEKRIEYLILNELSSKEKLTLYELEETLAVGKPIEQFVNAKYESVLKEFLTKLKQVDKIGEEHGKYFIKEKGKDYIHEYLKGRIN